MMQTFRNNKEKGFTLIELMIVVAIIGILAAIAIPQFSSFRTKAYNSAALTDLKNAMTQEEVYFGDNQTYGATSSLSITTSKNVTLTATTGSSTYYIVSRHSAGNTTYSVTGSVGKIYDSAAGAYK